MANRFYSVKINTCSNPKAWYHNHVGKTVKVKGCQFNDNGGMFELSHYDGLRKELIKHFKAILSKPDKDLNKVDRKAKIIELRQELRALLQFKIDPRDCSDYKFVDPNTGKEQLCEIILK